MGLDKTKRTFGSLFGFQWCKIKNKLSMMVCQYCQSGQKKPFCKGTDKALGLSKDSFIYYRCKNCYSIYRSSSKKEDISNFYTSSYAPYHGKKDKAKPGEESKRLKKRLELIKTADKRLNTPKFRKLDFISSIIKTNSKIVDYGCGTTNFLEQIKNISKENIELIGVDIGEKNLDGFASIGAKYMQREEFWADSSKYDVIHLNHVVEHDKEPASLLKKLRSKLTEKGLIIISCPNACSIWAKIFQNHWFSLDCPRHINIPSSKSIHILALNSGLNIDKFFLEYKHADFLRSVATLSLIRNQNSDKQGLFSFETSTKVLYLENSSHWILSPFLINLWFFISKFCKNYSMSDRMTFVLSKN